MTRMSVCTYIENLGKSNANMLTVGCWMLDVSELDRREHLFDTPTVDIPQPPRCTEDAQV